MVTANEPGKEETGESQVDRRLLFTDLSKTQKIFKSLTRLTHEACFVTIKMNGDQAKVYLGFHLLYSIFILLDGIVRRVRSKWYRRVVTRYTEGIKAQTGRFPC